MTYVLRVRTANIDVRSANLDNIGTAEQATELAKQIADVLEAGGIIQFESGEDIHIIPADAIEAVTVERVYG